MGRNLSHIALCVVALTLGSIVFAQGKSGYEPQSAKSQYVYAEALNAKYRGQMASHFHLVERAYELDTTNTAAAFYYGLCLLTEKDNTLEDAEKGLALMRKHFVAHPDDYYETKFYADACRSLKKYDQSLEAIKTLAAHYPYKTEVQTRLAETYSLVGDFANAIATYDSIETFMGVNLDISSRKAAAYFMLQDTLGMIDEMHKLLNTAPQNAVYNIAMANAMQQISLPDSALHYLNRAQEFDPDNGYTCLAKAQHFYLQGDSAQYDEQIYNALINQNLDVEAKMSVLTDYTRQLLQAKDSSQRVNRLFRVLIEQHPHEAEIHNLYSEYFVVKKDYTAAAEQLGYMLDIDPTDASGWRKLLLVNMLAENYPAAIEASEKALQFCPDSLELYRYVAPAYMQMKQYDNAIAIYDRAIAIADSTDFTSRSDLIGGKGDLFLSMGDTARALEFYEEAVEINPQNYGIMNNYAYALAQVGIELDKAERMSALAVNAYPNSATFIDTYAWVYYKKGEYKMALLYMRSAIDQSEEPNEDLLEHYGDILWADDSHKQAVEQWEKALELMPENETLKQKIRNAKETLAQSGGEESKELEKESE